VTSFAFFNIDRSWTLAATNRRTELFLPPLPRATRGKVPTSPLGFAKVYRRFRDCLRQHHPVSISILPSLPRVGRTLVPLHRRAEGTSPLRIVSEVLETSLCPPRHRFPVYRSDPSGRMTSPFFPHSFFPAFRKIIVSHLNFKDWPFA